MQHYVIFLTLKNSFTNQLQRFFPGCGGQLTGRLLTARANETQGRGPIALWDDCYFVGLKFCRAVPALDGVVPLTTPLLFILFIPPDGFIVTFSSLASANRPAFRDTVNV